MRARGENRTPDLLITSESLKITTLRVMVFHDI